MIDLIEHFSRYITVSDALRAEIAHRVTPRSVRKAAVLHDAGSICVESHFVRRGILRLYYLKDRKPITEYFCGEGAWVSSPRSFMFRELDRYYIDAIEDADVLTLHIDDLGFLFDHFPEMERYARLSMGTMVYQIVERMTSMRFTTAQDKYRHFCRTYKDLLPRLPLGMVASYLGITQETLSRVRAKR